MHRRADDELLETIAAQQFAYVLAPKATGKSSLMASAINRLRAAEQLAAVVDFNQIAARGEQVDSARWHYSIAYRICRELRLKINLQDWWHDKGLLVNEQRLVEFFADVVLAHSSLPVTIFFDSAERALDLPFSTDLFAALHSCYMRRVSEPDFARLNFVVLGASSARRLCPDPGVSPFNAGRAIRLENFTVDECATLYPGFERPAEDLAGIIERIHACTYGQPYLTQKLARAVARRRAVAADVEQIMHDLFLTPAASRDEPLLHQIRSSLTDGSAAAKQAGAMLARLGRGQEVIYDPVSPAQLKLEMAGIVSSDDNGMLHFNNPIVEGVFGRPRDQVRMPARWRRAAMAGLGVVALSVVLPYWYTQVMPRDDLAILADGSADLAELERAHARLGRWPGFGGLADEEFADAVFRRGILAQSIADIRAADAALRGLPAGQQIADELMAEFWLQRAELAAGRGQRDQALIHAMAAADAGSQRARDFAINLISGDYPDLEQTFHLDAPARSVGVDWTRGRLVVIDAAHRAHRWPIDMAGDDAVGALDSRVPPITLTALQHVGVTRSFFVDEPGTAGSLELRLMLDHPRFSDVLVRLRAPSGIAVEFELPAREGQVERFVMRVNDTPPLRVLADESITGEWELTLFDRLEGETGRLLSWGLRFEGLSQSWDDAPADGLALPDPVRTEQVDVALTDDGRLAVATPNRSDARGAASIWDLTSGERIADLPLIDRADRVYPLSAERLLLFGGRRVTLWDTGARATVAEIPSRGLFTGQPAVSPDQSAFALADFVDGTAEVSLYRVADGSLVSRFDTASWSDWMLGSGAAFLAVIDGSRRGRILDPTSGEVIEEFFHERNIRRIVPTRLDDRILAIDEDGGIFSWPLVPARPTASPSDSTALGRTRTPDSVVVAADGSVLVFHDAEGRLSIADPRDGAVRLTVDHGGPSRPFAKLSPSGNWLVSFSDSLVRVWHLGSIDHADGPFGNVSVAALDRSGSFGVLGYRGGEVALLPEIPGSIRSGKASDSAMGHRGVVTSLAVNASGELAASGDSDGVVRVWDTRTGRRHASVLRHPRGPITALAFSADGRWLASAGPDSARVFALASGMPVTEVGVEGRALSVALADDGGSVAVGDSTGNIFFASPDGSAGYRTIRGNSPITALVFAPNSDLLVSGSESGDVVIWDSLSLTAVDGAVSFSAPIRWIASESDASVLRVQSGGWVHVVDRTGGMDRVTTSRLLPARLRGSPSLALTRRGTLRALANAGGGQLVFGELDLTGARAGPRREPGEAAAALALPARNWARVLGIELDPVSGEVIDVEF